MQPSQWPCNWSFPMGPLILHFLSIQCGCYLGQDLNKVGTCTYLLLQQTLQRPRYKSPSVIPSWRLQPPSIPEFHPAMLHKELDETDLAQHRCWLGVQLHWPLHPATTLQLPRAHDLVQVLPVQAIYLAVTLRVPKSLSYISPIEVLMSHDTDFSFSNT